MIIAGFRKMAAFGARGICPDNFLFSRSAKAKRWPAGFLMQIIAAIKWKPIKYFVIKRVYCGRSLCVEWERNNKYLRRLFTIIMLLHTLTNCFTSKKISTFKTCSANCFTSKKRSTFKICSISKIFSKNWLTSKNSYFLIFLLLLKIILL